MPSRADMDLPASLLAAVLGVVLIVVSVPPLLALSNEGGQTYAITWDEVSLGKKAGPVGPSDTTLTLDLQDKLPSNATVSFSPCNDGAAPPLQSAATITWSFKEGATELGHGSTPCVSASPVVIALDDNGAHPKPDVGQADGDSDHAAEQAAYGDSNRTVQYTLTFRYTRPAGATGPLPLPPPAFSATANLEVKGWHATANLPGQEAPR